MRVAELMENTVQSARTGAWLYLDEVTHRALNDYTAMLCTVRHASLLVSDEAANEALNEVAMRLSAAAAAWQALRPPQGGFSRDLNLELEALCAALASSVLADRQIKLSLRANSITMSGRRCWQISLIVSELVVNAARHAFHSRQGGSIVVEVRAYGGMVQCSVIDDGVAAAVISPGRGSGIVAALAAELNGTISRSHTERGSTVVLRLPLREPSEN